MNALELSNLNKSYRDFSLQNMNLKVPTGCIVGFIGENGAGKSTTIKLILDLIHRDSGDIKVLGRDNRSASNDMKEHIGVVLDESCFPEGINAKDVNRIMKSLYKTWNEKRYESYLVKFSLPKDKVVKEYSKGMKMKLNIAVALSHDSKLLILDEATSGLDPIVRDEILDVFLDFIQEEDHTIFMSSHITSDLEKVCDYIAFIHKGKLIFCEEKDVLLTNYGILKCSQSDFQTIAPDAVKGKRQNAFGVEALVLRDKIRGGYTIDPARIEDIMVYMVKEGA